MSLAEKAGKAGSLLLFRKFWGGILNLAVMAYLARTLDQTDFGIVAISTTFIGIVQVLCTGGISDYIIFNSEDDQKKLRNAAFWLNLVLSVIVIILVLIVGPTWTNQFHDERIQNIVYLLLIGFLGSIMSMIPKAIFVKEVNFAPLVKIETIFGSISQVCQVILAYYGFGVYSIVVPNAIFAPIIAVSYFYKSQFRPSFKTFNIGYWKSIFSYSKHIIGTQLITKIVSEGDTILIGRLLGLHALGVYDISYKLANLFNNNLLPIISNISMPVFSKNKSDIQKVRGHYVQFIELIGFIFIPVFGFMEFGSNTIFQILYGNKWLDAVMPFQILLIFSIFRSLSSPTSGLFNALGKPQINFWATIALLPFIFGSIYYFSQFGLIAVCFAVTFSRVSNSIVKIFIVKKLISLNSREMIKALIFPIFLILLLAPFTLLESYMNKVLFLSLYFPTYLLFYFILFKKDLHKKLILLLKLIPNSKLKIKAENYLMNV
jgi:O-antigen/teichoic acid export membrane protein